MPSQAELDKSLAELVALREENSRLKLSLAARSLRDPAQPTAAVRPGRATDMSQAEKVQLFRSLFRGRDDVFAVRWEARDGRSGFAPANRYDAMRGAWRMRVPDGVTDEHLPISDAIIRDHLMGRHVIGVYPLLTDESCWFLAADFDKAEWEEDVDAVLRACDTMAIPASLERSRSGRGAHIWIFFAEPVPASQARKLGCALITRAMERRHQLGLDSYDRLFPNQDTMPRGGFGNLIALPLQRAVRSRHNTEFLDRDQRPYQDQWACLASIGRVTRLEVDAAVTDASRADAIIGVRRSVADDTDDDPWTRPPSRRPAEPRITDPLPAAAQIVLGNLVYIEKDGLPPALLNRLARLAAFQNPEFYKAQAMRLSTFDKPRVISCSEDLPQHLGLPRGCLGDALDVLEKHAVWGKVVDKRQLGGNSGQSSRCDSPASSPRSKTRRPRRCCGTTSGFSPRPPPSARR